MGLCRTFKRLFSQKQTVAVTHEIPSHGPVPVDCVGADLAVSTISEARETRFGDESFWDRFIQSVDGLRCDENLPIPAGQRSADYIFLNHAMIIELKTLESDPFENDSLRSKLIDDSESRTDQGNIDIARRAYVDHFHSRIKKVISSANDQIKSTLKIVNDSRYGSMIVIVDNAFYDIELNDATGCIERILADKSSFRSIDGCIYIPANMALIDGAKSLPIGLIVGNHATERTIRFGGAFMNSLIDFMGYNAVHGPKR